MKLIANWKVYRVAIAACAVLTVTLSGCHVAGDQGCKSDSECRTGRVCSGGVCVAASSITGTDAGDATTQDSSATDSGPDGTPYAGTVLELLNHTTGAIYYQATLSCDGHEGWYTLSAGGKELNLVRTCGACDCSQLPNNCTPGACPASCAISTIKKLDPNQSVTDIWGGMHWVNGTVGNQSCIRHLSVPRTMTVLAGFCWSLQAPADLHGQLTHTRCTTIPFNTKSRRVIDTITGGIMGG